ncbi:MAG: hypothetical protein JWM92_522 [Candidatus Nomurabacteria bacterium]|nr:hypothetical protein [Candidatus Nomurabacteria bacterium]
MEQETLTVKFDGQEHQVDVQTFAYSVLNFATVIKEANKKVTGSPIEINIKAPEKGSVLVDLVTKVTQSPTLLHGLHTGADLVTVVAGLYGFHKFISGRKIKETKKEDGGITIHLEDGSTMTVAENVYNIYVTTPAISNGISQHFSALSDDPAVSKFEVIRKEKRIIEVDKEDYDRLSIKQQIETENARRIVESAELHVYKIVFDKTDRKWEFYYKGNRISANITDEDFFKMIDGGESFAKGDLLRVDLQINQSMDESVGIYVNQSYQVLKVHEHIKRLEQAQLPFNKTLDD